MNNEHYNKRKQTSIFILNRPLTRQIFNNEVLQAGHTLHLGKAVDGFQRGNPKTRKPETGNRSPESETRIRNRNQKPETGIRNPESTNQRKQMQVLQVSENYLAKLLSAKK